MTSSRPKTPGPSEDPAEAPDDLEIVAADDLRELCRDLWRPLVGTLTIKTGSQDIAEELAQEALARAWERWPEVRTMDAPDRWVFRVALNLGSSWRRRRAAERRARQRLEQQENASHMRRHDVDPSAIAVRAALAELTERQRMIIGLRYYGGRSVSDVAAICGIAEGTVKATTSQAIERLRSWLDDEELTR